jgi:hypothetical protein
MQWPRPTHGRRSAGLHQSTSSRPRSRALHNLNPPKLSQHIANESFTNKCMIGTGLLPVTLGQRPPRPRVPGRAIRW